MGIHRKHPLAWKLGFVLIAALAAWFALCVIRDAVQKEGSERWILLMAAMVGSTVVAAFWMEVWRRQQRHFPVRKSEPSPSKNASEAP